MRPLARLLPSALLLLTACRSPVPTPPTGPAHRPEVAVCVFEAPVNPAGDDPVRELERRLGAVELATALETDAGWSRVRVTPSPEDPAELVVTGRILPAPPGGLRLRLRAEDASGRVWLNREYEDADGAALAARAAGDLAAARRELPDGESQELPRLASLRAAARLASPSFAQYLDRDENGRLSILRLPAEDDPQWRAAQVIHARERLLADLLDARYRALGAEAAPHLSAYRALARREATRRLSLERASLLQPFRILAGGLIEGFGIFTESLAGLESRADGPLQRATDGLNARGDTLVSGLERDLAASRASLLGAGHLLHAELAPSVVELDGKVTELTGDAETQYARFRQILRARVEEETGGAPAP